MSLTALYSASSITRDVSRIIRENIATRQGHPVPQSANQYPSHSPFVPIQGPNQQDSPLSGQTHLRINILQSGKRILPRFDLPAGQCPNVDTMKQAVLRRYSDQIPNLPFDNIDPAVQQTRNPAASWNVKVWLPHGLVTVENDKDWTAALLSTGTVEWMDGDLKVLVDIDDANTQR